jgi:hypothetical protein
VAVAVTVTNEGWLPTHLTQRGAEGRSGQGGRILDPVVPEPLAVLEVEGGRHEVGSGRIRFPHLAGTNPHTDAVTERSREVRWVVVRDGDAELRVRVTIQADKGGTVQVEGAG